MNGTRSLGRVVILSRQSERCFRSASLIFSEGRRRHDSSEGNNPPMSRRNYTGFSSYIRPYVSVQRLASDPRRERRRHVQHVSRRTCAISHRRETRFSEAPAPHLAPLPSPFPAPYIHRLRGILRCIPQLKPRMHAMHLPSGNCTAKIVEYRTSADLSPES